MREFEKYQISVFYAFGQAGNKMFVAAAAPVIEKGMIGKFSEYREKLRLYLYRICTLLFIVRTYEQICRIGRRDKPEVHRVVVYAPIRRGRLAAVQVPVELARMKSGYAGLVYGL